MDSKSLLIGYVGLSLTAAPISAQLNNGSFESPLLSPGANYFVPAIQLAPWQTSDASFEVWASTLSGESAADGTQHLEILAQTNAATVWQTVATIPGEDYTFRFQHSARPGVDSVLTVAINSQIVAVFSEIGSLTNAFHWQRFRTNFTATTHAVTVSFTDTAFTAAGTHIDNVIVERLPVLATIAVSEVQVCWETVTTKAYQPEFRSALTANVWMNLGGTIQGNGLQLCIKDTVSPGEPQRFYRVNAIP